MGCQRALAACSRAWLTVTHGRADLPLPRPDGIVGRFRPGSPSTTWPLASGWSRRRLPVCSRSATNGARADARWPRNRRPALALARRRLLAGAPGTPPAPVFSSIGAPGVLRRIEVLAAGIPRRSALEARLVKSVPASTRSAQLDPAAKGSRRLGLRVPTASPLTERPALPHLPGPVCLGRGARLRDQHARSAGRCVNRRPDRGAVHEHRLPSRRPPAPAVASLSRAPHPSSVSGAERPSAAPSPQNARHSPAATARRDRTIRLEPGSIGRALIDNPRV